MRLSHVLCAVLLAFPAAAQNFSTYQPPAPTHKITEGRCTPTPSLGTVNYPGADKIPPNNNLIMPAGKAVEAEGQKLFLFGRVLDRNCMPIKGAHIEIWQTDPFGKWFLATRGDLASPVPTFAGAGRTYSSNVGDFVFYTLFPSSVNKRAPFINIKVKVRDMKTLETQLFFANDGRNSTDAVYNRLKGGASQGVTVMMRPLNGYNGFQGTIDLVMGDKAKYVGY